MPLEPDYIIVSMSKGRETKFVSPVSGDDTYARAKAIFETMVASWPDHKTYFCKILESI